MDDRVDQLTQALRRAGRSGCRPDLVLRDAIMRELLAVRVGRVPARDYPGTFARGRLAELISSYEGSRRFNGRKYEPEDLIDSALYLLGLESTGLRPDARREYLINRLQLDVTATEFRKNGLEWQFYRMFASDLIVQAAQDDLPNCDQHFASRGFNLR